jgi:hypothetical protein
MITQYFRNEIIPTMFGFLIGIDGVDDSIPIHLK